MQNSTYPPKSSLKKNTELLILAVQMLRGSHAAEFYGTAKVHKVTEVEKIKKLP